MMLSKVLLVPSVGAPFDAGRAAERLILEMLEGKGVDEELES